MVKRNDKNTAVKNTKLTETENSLLLAKRQPKENPNDDLIVSLSNAYENIRARQVFEWERVRRQNSIQRAA